ncbi:AAA family ATPase [Diaphorobacter sp. HDW4A]|uniref:replicative DNA helicase n=1 Tax=Diaphorobacter sp. HDW4A TaxID=2714924 RepID=UPI001407BDAE|nr:DnaB-like helicase C-terminal domain-containing protein [Diaphorobacter sp. HDW4A]QIL80996.1 AAA family ATPase [Diaphorobacter sp. HDW4A]
MRNEVPCSAEAEAGLLGGLLMDNSMICHASDLVAEAFHFSEYRDVWQAIHTLAKKNKPFDVVSVMVQLGEMGSSVNVAYLHDLAQYVPSAGSMRRYAEVIEDRYRSRQLMDAGSEICDMAMMPGAVAAEQLDKAQMMLAKLATVKGRRDPQFIHESLAKYLDLLQDLSEGKNPAIRTGIGGLDKLLNGGMRRGEVMVIGARPKHGKTALALAMARNMARDHSVLFLSQEMPINQLMHRHTAAAGSFDLARILAADPEDQKMWSAVTAAARRLEVLHLNHDDQCSLSLMDIRRKALKVRRERGLDVLFVDFLQLMAGAGEESRNRELDVIVNGIKSMALDLEICAVVLSQMSRKADEHYGRPTMSHLRDSGAIEAAADQIALLFTDWAHPLSKRTKEFQGYSELEIVAHRNGPQGLVPLEFIGQCQQMGDWLHPIPVKQSSTAPTGFSGRAAKF